jgi:hypothetical protein
MIAAILAILQGVLEALNKTLPKYFPPKSTEQKVQEGQAAIDEKLAGEQSTGRPQ